MRTNRMLAITATTTMALTLTLSACGDDAPGEVATGATTQPDAATPTTTPGTTAASATPGTTSANATADPYCALATEMASQESTPTAEQLTRYQSLAPAEIADTVAAVAPTLIAAGDDMVAFFAAYAVDEVEAALNEINRFETATCGIEHEDRTTPPPGASRDIEDGAARVDVNSIDYTFEIPAVEAGRTSFVLTNNGHEAHFLAIFKLAEGATLEQAMQSEDDSLIEGVWETGVAAPGGEDEEVITFDLEPGTYGVACFIAGPDGTPHAFMGMHGEFVVA